MWSDGYRICTAPRPTTVKYALIPHKGAWNTADLNGEATNWNEPLLATFGKPADNTNKSLGEMCGTGCELISMQYKGDTLTVRFYNASGSNKRNAITVNGQYRKAEWIELNEAVKAPAVAKGNKVEAVILSFGFRTLRLVGFATR